MTATKRALVMLLVVFLTGCLGMAMQHSISSARASYQHYAERAQSQFRSGDLAGATASWASASNSVDRNGSYYLTGLIYQDYWRAQAASAWIDLQSGDSQAANAQFREIFEGLLSDERNHKAVVQADNESQQISLAFMRAAVSVGAAYAEMTSSPMKDAFQAIVFDPMQLAFASSSLADAGDLVEPFLGDEVESDGVRVVALASIEPLTLIGRLQGGGSSCTANLVGYRVAVTNAHCVTDDEGELVEAKKFLVFDSINLPDAVTVVETRIHANKWDREFRNDWAVLILDRHPMGRGYFGVSDSAPDPQVDRGNIFMAGFSGDLNDGRFHSVSWGCSVLTVSNGVFVKNCKSAQGASGSAVFRISHELDFELIGLHAFGKNSIEDDSGVLVSIVGGGPTADMFSSEILDARARTVDITTQERLGQ